MAITVKAGKITIPGNNFSVTGVGFEPKAVLFLWTDATAEDTWTTNTTGMINWGMGMAAYRNSVSDLSIINAATYQCSQSNDVASTFTFSHAFGTRATRNFSVGYRFLVTSFDADGFTLAPPSGITNAGHVGQFIYYMAFGGDESAAWFYDPGHTTYNVGWEPDAFINLGGMAYSQGYEVGIQWADLCQTYIAAGRYSTGDFKDPLLNLGVSLSTGVSDYGASFNDPRWAEVFYGSDSTFGAPNLNYSNFYSADSQGSGLGPHCPYCDVLQQKTTSTTVQMGHGVNSSDFGLGGGTDSEQGPKVEQLLFELTGNQQVEIGSFVPSTTVSEVVSVDMAITDPIAVILFAGQGDSWGDTPFGTPYSGDFQTHMGNSIGFLTSSFQCTVAASYVGAPSGGAGARFSSSTKACVSNTVTPNASAIGTARLVGSAALTSTGLDFTTTENTADSPHRIVYWAIGDLAPIPPEAPVLTGSCYDLNSDLVLLLWNNPDDNGTPVTGFNVYRGLSPGTETYYVSTASTSFGKIDDAAEGILHYYYVTAVSDAGESVPSNEVSVQCLRPGLFSFHHDHTFALVDGLSLPGLPPDNDLISQADVISGESGTVFGTTLHATTDGSAGDLWWNYYGYNVWYVWTAPHDGILSLTTAGHGSEPSNNVAVLLIHKIGSDPTAWVIVQDDYNFGTGYYGHLDAFVESGQVYYIQIGTMTGSDGQGGFELSWSRIEPVANDLYEDAILLSGTSGSVNGTTINATIAGDADDYWWWWGGNSVWYKWVAPANGLLTITTAPSGATPTTNTALLIVDHLTSSFYDDDYVSEDGNVTDGYMGHMDNVPVVAGHEYRISVEVYYDMPDAAGTFTLSWSFV